MIRYRAFLDQVEWEEFLSLVLLPVYSLASSKLRPSHTLPLLGTLIIPYINSLSTLKLTTQIPSHLGCFLSQ